MSDSFGARCPIVLGTERRVLSDSCDRKSARCPIPECQNGACCPIVLLMNGMSARMALWHGVVPNRSSGNGARCPIGPRANGARCPIPHFERFPDLSGPFQTGGRTGMPPQGLPGRAKWTVCRPVRRKMSDSFYSVSVVGGMPLSGPDPGLGATPKAAGTGACRVCRCPDCG